MSSSGDPVIPDKELRLSIVLNSVHPLGQVEGVVILAMRIELTDERVWLYGRALANDETQRLTTDFWRQARRWRDTVQSRGWEAAGEPPDEPGKLMSRVRVVLAERGPGGDFDSQVAFGGSGTEWDIHWSWPRPAGESLTFISSSPEAGTSELTIDIPRST